MTRITEVKIGSPMGFKVNIGERVDLNVLVDDLKTYHGGKYIIGKDTMFIDTPHYHIHWFSVKVVTAGALKTFRSTLTKKLTWLTKSDKLYTGQEIDSADPDRWLAYCIKEELISVTGYEVTDKIEILRKASLENKRQNKVYSEKKAVIEKEKKDFKNKMLENDEFKRQRMNNYDYVSKVQRLVKHVQDRRRLAEENKVAARNRVLGGILSTGGMVVGGMMGGPMGAAAGSNAGRLAGNQQMQQGSSYGGSSGMGSQGPSYGKYAPSNGYGGINEGDF